MRKRMLDAAARDGRDLVGSVLRGRTVGEVVASRYSGLAPGDLVVGWGGWREFVASPGEAVVKVDDAGGRPSLWLSVLGRPGITAWLGVVHTARVGSGDVIIVSSAAGAVGSIAGQLARRRGARVVGIAGGPAKCAWLLETARFDAAVDYKSPDFADQLAAALPDGATAVFECVGGRILDESMSHLRPEGRIALCGLIDRYQGAPPYAYRNFHLLLERGLRLEGFRIDDHEELHGRAREDLRAGLESGDITIHETITDGLEQAPQAFVDMMEGRGFGKRLVRVAD